MTNKQILKVWHYHLALSTMEVNFFKKKKHMNYHFTHLRTARTKKLDNN